MRQGTGDSCGLNLFLQAGGGRALSTLQSTEFPSWFSAVAWSCFILALGNFKRGSEFLNVLILWSILMCLQQGHSVTG